MQSVMNYSFVSGLTTHVTSVENPTSINSWVKVLCVLILYVLCISSITVCNARVVFIAIYMPGVSSVFPPPLCAVVVKIMLPLKNTLLRC